MTVVDVLWQCEALRSSEHCRFTEGVSEPGVVVLRGVTTLAIDDAPGHIVWHVATNATGATLAVEIQAVGATTSRGFAVHADGRGNWRIDGLHGTHLDGCLDVDLGWTPATNTLPIHRLGLPVGGEETIAAAWLRFPELVWERSEQTYARLAPDRWRYRSGRYDFELVVDAETGLVRRYGDDLWRAVAWSRTV